MSAASKTRLVAVATPSYNGSTRGYLDELQSDLELAIARTQRLIGLLELGIEMTAEDIEQPLGFLRRALVTVCVRSDVVAYSKGGGK